MLAATRSATGRSGTPRRPRLGVMKFASCDGCQLTLLDLENELLDIVTTFDVVEFAEASSHRSSGPYDLVLVEGSISTPEQAEEIVRIRHQTPLLVSIGACATAGGIQALRNWREHGPIHEAVYAMPEYVDSLATSTPISDHVTVDAELRGCPIDPGQLLELLTALSVGRRPQLPDASVCLECKRRGTVCVMVARDMPCLGPVTHTGCGAMCPAFDRGCYGCFGPHEGANATSLATWFGRDGRPASETAALFSGFTAYAEPFRRVIDDHGGPPSPTATAGPATAHDGGTDDARD